MGDFSGPITSCFTVAIIIIATIIIVPICIFSYKDDVKDEKEKQEMYLNGQRDAINRINRQIDSIKITKKN